jgi:hypothetical protein
MGERHGIEVEKHRRAAKPGSERHIGTMTWEIKRSIGMGAELKRLRTDSVILNIGRGDERSLGAQGGVHQVVFLASSI